MEILWSRVETWRGNDWVAGDGFKLGFTTVGLREVY